MRALLRACQSEAAPTGNGARRNRRHVQKRGGLVPVLAWVAVCVSGTACVVLDGSTARAAGPQFTVRHDARKIISIGGLRVSGVTGGAARARFGEPSNVRELFGGTSCVVEWRPIGLAIVFGDLSGANEACGGGGRVDTFSIHGAAAQQRWRTQTGLRIGAASSRVPHLYPRARRHGSAWWLITERSFLGGNCSPPAGCRFAVLRAVVTRGRISSIRGVVGGSGE
jgi:hypothetical protein